MGYLSKQANTTRIEVQTATPLKTTSSYNMTLPGKISYYWEVLPDVKSRVKKCPRCIYHRGHSLFWFTG